jgi:hypothetical protein
MIVTEQLHESQQISRKSAGAMCSKLVAEFKTAELITTSDPDVVCPN